MHRFVLPLTVVLTAVACDPGGATAPLRADQGCRPGARFQADLYGALRSRVSWQGEGLHCEGMARPFGEGARLRFAGRIAEDTGDLDLAVIVAVPGMEPGAVSKELPATLTLIEEKSGRFFSNGKQQTCWADVLSQQPIDGAAHAYAVNGIVYCVAPLPALHDNVGVTIRNLEFAGRVDWRSPGE